MYKEVQIGRLYEQIVEQIEGRILSGGLRPGDKLPAERELARQFGVSRTSVREAMKALTLKGLIEVYPGKGTFVSDGASEAARHSLDLMLRLGEVEGSRYLVEIREILEPEIAALAALRAEDEHVSAMRDAVAAMDRALDDREAFIESDLDFHLALAEAAQNALVLVIIDTLVDLLRGLRKQTALVEGGLERGQFHHRRILSAIERGDAKAARQAMRSHLLQVREDSEIAISAENLK